MMAEKAGVDPSKEAPSPSKSHCWPAKVRTPRISPAGEAPSYAGQDVFCRDTMCPHQAMARGLIRSQALFCLDFQIGLNPFALNTTLRFQKIGGLPTCYRQDKTCSKGLPERIKGTVPCVSPGFVKRGLGQVSFSPLAG